MLLPAGFIDGGRVYGETLRRALYASTAGATGVVRSDDLRVVALATPGPAVVISPGAGVIATRYTDADPGQSYSVSVGAALTLPVPANNTPSTRTWHVIIRVTDPQYVGESVPDDPEDATYTVAELVATLPTTRPFLHLATLRVPANTGVVVPSAIEDTRRIAQPRSVRLLRAFDIPADSRNRVMDWNGDYRAFSAAVSRFVDVPEWATEVHAKVDWQSLVAPVGWNVSQFTVRFGGGAGEPSPVFLNPTTLVVGSPAAQTNSLEERRMNIGVSGSWRIPPAWRGRRITVAGDARRAQGNMALHLDLWSSASIDLQFTETAQQ